MASISIRNGKGSTKHNNRTIKNKYGSHQSWDNELTKNNIIYCDKDIKKVYSELFDKAVQEYNDKQPRADRQIKNYLEKIRLSKQEKVSYEMIIQIGDIYDKDNGDYHLYEQALDEYNKGFQERNKSLSVVQQITHNDELGGAHTHIHYVPVSHQTGNGLSIKNSLKGALKELGFTGRYNLMEWQNQERQVLKEIMQELGIEFTDKNDVGRSHLSVPEYKKVINQAEQQAEKIVSDAEHQAKLIVLDATKTANALLKALKINEFEIARLLEKAKTLFQDLFNRSKTFQMEQEQVNGRTKGFSLRDRIDKAQAEYDSLTELHSDINYYIQEPEEEQEEELEI